MPRFVYVGQKYGRLTVKAPAGRSDDKYKKLLWKCKCDCGQDTVSSSHLLLTGHKRSCGCIRKERPNGTRHGASIKSERKWSNPKWRTYAAWSSMRQRCNTPSCEDYKYYGGRGIKHDPSWSSFEQFLADMGPVELGYSLERIDVNGPYSKENCKWATRLEQARNKSNTRMLELNGVKKPAAQWAKERGINHTTLFQRLKRGWSVERALTTAVTPTHYHSGP